MTFLLNLPRHTRKQAQKILWSVDPEADVIEERAGDLAWRASTRNAGESTYRRIARVRRSLGVERPIYYCLTSSGAQQACAFMVEGRHCIAIWMGVLVLSQRALHRLAITPELAEKLFALAPKPGLQLRGLAEGVSSLEAFRLLSSPYQGPIPPLMSDDERLVVTALSTHLTDFVTYHELGHVVNGHVGLAAETELHITEYGGTDANADDMLTFHTLEWDADQFAATRVFFYALESEFPTEGMYNWNNQQQRAEWRLRLAIMAIYFACRLFQRVTFSAQTAMNEKHPPGILRLGLMLPQAEEAWSKATLSKDLPFPSGIINDAIQRCEIAIEQATGIAADPAILGEIDPDWFADYHRSLFDRWDSLLPRLNVTKLRSGSLPMRPAGT